jgi:Pyridoxamine 5'-phosphate oxidase
LANVTGVPALLDWQDVELGAPEIARLGRTRLDSAHVALLGTLRRDGSPRISPIEPHFAHGQLLIGAMAWSAKTGDLRRDPRYVLHSVVTDPDSQEGELKLYGSAGEAGQHLRDTTAHAWWLTWEREKAVVFTLHIGQAVFVDWDIKHGLMTVHRWSSRSGYSVASRSYP